jgi:hypothetical protein
MDRDRGRVPDPTNPYVRVAQGEDRLESDGRGELRGEVEGGGVRVDAGPAGTTKVELGWKTTAGRHERTPF